MLLLSLGGLQCPKAVLLSRQRPWQRRRLEREGGKRGTRTYQAKDVENEGKVGFFT